MSLSQEIDITGEYHDASDSDMKLDKTETKSLSRKEIEKC